MLVLIARRASAACCYCHVDFSLSSQINMYLKAGGGFLRSGVCVQVSGITAAYVEPVE